jgi:CHAT domain-containing protein
VRRLRGMAVYSTEMSRAGVVGCPGSNLLAAYVECRLDAQATSALEAHLASCSDCSELLAEALSVREVVVPRVTSVDEPAETAGRWTRRVVRGGAVAAAIVAALVLPEMARPRRDYKLADLAAAAGARWPVEGRLTGGIPHSSLNAPLAGGQGGAVGDPVRVQLVAGKIREDLDARGTPEHLHSFGLSQLLQGRLDAASVALTAAAREQPLNAAYQSDAAALFLERARANLRPDDLPRALAAAERARLANPAMLEGAFNRALALERLSLTAQARQAWMEYLSRDSSSSWAGEARSHLEALNRSPSADRWPAVEARLKRQVNPAVADEAVLAHMTGARNFIETELFPAWAAAVARGDGSAERESLRALATAFAREGDNLYSDAVAAIDRAESRGGEQLRRLAAAHHDYAAAAAILADDRFRDAAQGLTLARQALAGSGSAFAVRAELDLAVVAFYTGQIDRAGEALTALDKVAQSRRYPFVSGRVSWVQGLLAFGVGQYGGARAAWETTLATFEALGDSEQTVGARGLLAGLHDALGDDAEAWLHRDAALRGLDGVQSARLKHGILAGAAGATWKKHSAEAALALQNEVVANALAMRRPAAVADAFVQRAAILLDLRRAADAKRDIAATRDHTRSVSEPLLRDRRESALLELEARMALDGNPRLAAATANRAILLAQATNDRARLATLHLLLARAEIRAGRVGEAERAASSGLEAFASQRALVANAGGTSRDNEAWGLFEVAMGLALTRKDTARAFSLAASARSRDASSSAAAEPADLLARVQSRLREDEAVVAMNQLDDELVVWLIKKDVAEIIRRPLSRQNSARLAARHRDEIELEARLPRASAELFNEFVRPFGDRLKSVSHVAFVPDAPYYSVSFAALWDRTRDRFVIEDRSVSVLSDVGALANVAAPASAPSGSAFVDLALPSTADAAFAVWSSAPERAVVRVAVPVRANGEYPGLSSVTFADAPGRRYSGLVLTREIAERDLSRLGVVILSDCKSERDPGEGQGTLGAAAAFLAAGVPSVVATLWPIGENERLELFAGLDRELRRHNSAAAALRGLQRDVLRQNGGRLGAWTGLVSYGVGR